MGSSANDPLPRGAQLVRGGHGPDPDADDRPRHLVVPQPDARPADRARDGRARTRAARARRSSPRCRTSTIAAEIVSPGLRTIRRERAMTAEPSSPIDLAQVGCARRPRIDSRSPRPSREHGDDVGGPGRPVARPRRVARRRRARRSDRRSFASSRRRSRATITRSSTSARTGSCSSSRDGLERSRRALRVGSRSEPLDDRGCAPRRCSAERR